MNSKLPNEVKFAALHPSDRTWVSEMLISQWGSIEVVSRGQLHLPTELPGFSAFQNHSPVGSITFNIVDYGCEIVTLNSLVENVGIGSTLIANVKQVARQNSCHRLWVITTNDNLPALRFYQKRGFHIAAIYPNSIEISRKIKPTIPELGYDDIPIRDEIELEIRFLR